MATTTAPTHDPNGSAPPLWQAPVFVLGVAALVAAWLGRPLWPDCAAGRARADLDAARQLLARPDGDAELALKHATAAQDACARLPEGCGEAAYLAGSAYIRQAEKADPVRSRELWQQAKEALGRASREGVPEEDQRDLPYRVAKVGFYTSEALPAVISRLEEAVPGCSTRAEGFRLLTEAYLRLPQPDLAKALAANQRLRDVAEAGEADLTLAKLQGGEILLRLGKPDEARRSLEKIGEQAAPALVVKARLLRAQTYQEEKQWGEATRLYNAALADNRAPVGDPAPIHYHLGQCYCQLDQPQGAVKAWLECVRVSRGPEGTAAALKLVEQRLAEQALEPALEMLTQAAGRVTSPGEWQNPHVDLKKAQSIYEDTVSACRKAGRHDLALKALEPYAKLAEPRRLLALRGEVAAGWARAKQEAAARSPDGERQAEELHRLAGDAYAKAAELKGLPLAEQGEFVWLAARSFLAGKDDARALVRLEQVVTMNLEPARLGEAWYLLSTAYRAAGKPELALKAGKKCMEYDTPFAHRARHALAMSHLEKGDLDEAEATLVFNLKMLRWESDPDALAESLFALGNLMYQRKDYRRVVRYLEDALGRFKDRPELTNARFQLADSYRQIAAQENQSFLLSEGMSPEAQAHFQKEHRRWLQKAAEEFAALEQFLESPEGKDHLTPELRGQVPAIAAKCLFNVGQFDKALAIFEKLIDRHDGKMEALEAAGGAVSCYAAKGQTDKLKQRLLQIKLMLPKMPEDVRKPWEEWLDSANKMLSET
ncbi:MAG: tetratricopeptide repeat protein [Gemmataceae bacterium]